MRVTLAIAALVHLATVAVVTSAKSAFPYIYKGVGPVVSPKVNTKEMKDIKKNWNKACKKMAKSKDSEVKESNVSFKYIGDALQLESWICKTTTEDLSQEVYKSLKEDHKLGI